MRKGLLGPAGLLAFALAALPASYVFSSPEKSAASEEAETLQMIASYRAWGKANPQPIVVPIDKMAAFG